MLEEWQLKIYLQAQAEMIRVEGMKVENSQRVLRGEAAAYSEEAFCVSADEIDRLAHEINGT